MRKLRKYGILVCVAGLVLIGVFAQFSAVINACGCRKCKMVVTSGTSDWVRILGNSGPYKPAVETWVHPKWPIIEDAAWISSNYTVEDPKNDSWRAFLRIFYIPGSVYSASINITSDNAYELYINGEFVGSDGEVYGPFIDDHEWSDIEEYDLTPILRQGLNWVWIVVRNYGRATAHSPLNPTGLIYRIEITYRC